MSSSSRNKERGFALIGSHSGFTLIEVLISMTLLVIISLSIYKATTESYHLRDVLSHEGDFYNSIRLSMSILQRDVSMIYTPTLILPPQQAQSVQNPLVPTPPPNQEQMQMMSDQNFGQTSDFWGAAIDMSGIRPSHFIGTATKMSFISLSHVRMYKETPETEFAKITYELQSGQAEDDVKANGVLVKTESPNAFTLDDSQDPFKHNYELLTGIQSLRFEYYDKVRDHLYSNWDSEADDFKGRYPDEIRVTVDVTGPAHLSFHGNYTFRPEIPLSGLNPSF